MISPACAYWFFRFFCGWSFSTFFNCPSLEGTPLKFVRTLPYPAPQRNGKPSNSFIFKAVVKLSKPGREKDNFTHPMSADDGWTKAEVALEDLISAVRYTVHPQESSRAE